MHSTSQSAASMLLVLMAACGSATQWASDTRPQRSSRYVLVAEDLRATGAEFLYDAVQQLRPGGLTPQGSSVRQGAIAGAGATSSRGDVERSQTSASTGVATLEPFVVQDGIALGGIQYLQTIAVAEVEQVRFIEGSEAARRWGPRAALGAIEVIRQRS